MILLFRNKIWKNIYKKIENDDTYMWILIKDSV